VDLGVPDTINETPDQVVQGFSDINTVLNQIVATQTPVTFTNSFQLPLKNFTRYGAPFGELRKTGDNLVRHLGTDFTAPLGTPVMAIQDGTVRLATSTDLYGNTIVLDHGAGIYSLYLHLSRMDVGLGANVTKGETIGAVGQTGYAFGPHLHLSVKVNGVAVDPVRFIQSFK
jgi:murein DD-endopeptidase MepM/ murein hydrolase activator NlpD